jgi:hypothetical protein
MIATFLKQGKPSPHTVAFACCVSAQVDADGFRFSGLRIDANFKRDNVALGDFTPVSQC